MSGSRLICLRSTGYSLAMIAIGAAIHHTLITNQGLVEQIVSGNWLGGTRPF
jgi:hypothetical protein